MIVPNFIYQIFKRSSLFEQSTEAKLAMCCLILEIHCGPIEVVRNSDYNSSIPDVPGNAVEYNCKGDFKFIDGETTKTAECTSWGEWTPIADSCEGRK